MTDTYDGDDREPGRTEDLRDQAEGYGRRTGDVGEEFRDRAAGLGQEYRGQEPGTGQEYQGRDRGAGLGQEYRSQEAGTGPGQEYQGRDRAADFGQNYRGEQYRGQEPGAGYGQGYQGQERATLGQEYRGRGYQGNERGAGIGQEYRAGDRFEAENPLRMLGQAAWQALMVLGLAAIAIGICAVVWPGRTLLVIGVLFGIYLIISGVMEIIAAFGDHISAGMRVLNVVVGAMSILLGLFCFRNSLHNSVLLLSLWIGIGFLMWGVATIATSASAPPGVVGRGWGMVAGFLTMLGGIIVISWPIGSIFTLAIFTGIWLIGIGLVEVIHAFTLRGKVRQAGTGATGRHVTV